MTTPILAIHHPFGWQFAQRRGSPIPHRQPRHLRAGTRCLLRAQVTISGNADNAPALLQVSSDSARARSDAPPSPLPKRPAAPDISVAFSEPVLGGAEVPSNYTLDGGVTVLAASLSADGIGRRSASPRRCRRGPSTRCRYPPSTTGLTIPNPIAAGSAISFFFAGSPLPEDLVAHWSFDEGAGNSARGRGRAGMP